MEIGLAEREGHQSDLVSGVKGGRVEVGGGRGGGGGGGGGPPNIGFST